MKWNISNNETKMKQEKKDRETMVSLIRESRRKGKLPIYKENPYWQPYEVQIGKKMVRIAGGMYVSNEGEKITQSAIHQIKEVDEEEFIKLYTKNIKAFFDIKPSTQKVLMAILEALQKAPNADSILLPWFRVEEYSLKNDLKISHVSFHRAMNELLEKGFIAEAEEPNKYWINPHLFFNGNRMIFVHEYRKKTTNSQISKKTERKEEMTQFDILNQIESSD